MTTDDFAPAPTLPADTSAARWTTVHRFEIFADGSGVSALLECGPYRFACSLTGDDPRVNPVQSRDGNRRIPVRHLRCAEADFAALLAANLSDEYRAKCRAMYR